MRRIKFRWSTCMTAWYWHQPSFSNSRSTTGFVSRNSRSSGAWAAVLEACYQGWHLEDVVSFKDHACFAPVAWYGIECREKLPWLRLGCKMWQVYLPCVLTDPGAVCGLCHQLDLGRMAGHHRPGSCWLFLGEAPRLVGVVASATTTSSSCTV